MAIQLDEAREGLLVNYPATASAAIENLELWREGSLPFVDYDVLSEFLDGAPLDLVHESFWRTLPFGTGGVRGTVGLGPNRMNRTLVALTIQAHCDFLDDHLSAQPSIQRAVVLANDVRVFRDLGGNLKFLTRNPLLGLSSREMAVIAARVYAANGFAVHMVEPGRSDALLTTPELSFLINHLHAAGGINMSASHNPPDDNGIKIYDESGGQYLPPFDQRLTDLTKQVRHVRMVDFDEAQKADQVIALSAAEQRAYLDLYMSKAELHDLRSKRNERILFTPLCGCGERTVGAALDELGYRVHVPEDQRADGSFSSIPLLAPNPEVPEATEPARREADTFKSSLIISCDPDADRIGVEVRRTSGKWTHLTGNQIATILAYRLLLDPGGPQLRGAVYQTIVTSAAVRAIAEQAGCQHVVDTLLVGFKYIGAAIKDYAQELPEASEDDLLAFAAEESHGYLVTPRLRDKDALSAALYVARLHEDLTAEDDDLVAYLERVYDHVGSFGDRGRAFSITGSAGVAAIASAMRQLRDDPPVRLGGKDVLNFVDYWNEEPPPNGFGPFASATDNEARNVLVFELDDARVTLRPSGTEPKLKFYVSTAAGKNGEAAQDGADELATAVYVNLAPLFDVDLSPIAAKLPDVIPVEAKMAFDKSILSAAEQMFSDDHKGVNALAGWLEDGIARLIPGEDKVAIAAPALLEVAATWSAEARSKLHATLESVGHAVT